jgi:WD40 repeat protein
LRTWNVDTGEIVASLEGPIGGTVFAAHDTVVVTTLARPTEHEIVFYPLLPSGGPLRRIVGKDAPHSLAVSPDTLLVASSTYAGLVELLNAERGELLGSLHGHLNAAFGIAFSPDGRRLISTSGGNEAVKIWDVGTQQELLTLPGRGSFLHQASWSADGNTIIVGQPWQAWSSPSWIEIAAGSSE